ncbi:MAG TPA: response regulator [Acidimicrobiales bacterium]|nr:response regulator [Acidimicrobiales bacterium]
MPTVLIVDDEPDIVLFAQVNLELSGYDVLVAPDGEAALEQVRSHHPDVVLLDVMMPRLDGWAVLERLKADADPSIRTIPVVMLTALSTDHDQVRGGIEGAVRYLPKPVTPDAMLAAIDDALTAGPEPEQRKAAQQQALSRLARIERGDPAPSQVSDAPRPRLSRLERPRPVEAPAPPLVRSAEVTLSPSQRTLLRALQETSSVSDAATALGMSRSNIYASLRRIGRKLDEHDASQLLRKLRAGDLAHLLEE